MTNPSIFAAFERMWQHVVSLAGGKANAVHSHDDLYYTEAEVDEMVSGAVTSAESAADTKISTHNTSESAHNDIRLLITGLNDRLNALANSDDTTLDQMAELVEYIKDNRELIEGVTTNKVNVSDIIDNLTTNVSNKPLSAAQGVALKALIDAIEVPTKVSDLTNDSGFITSHQDISGKLDKSGGTMTGALTLATDPTENLQAATKQYVDTGVSSANTAASNAQTTANEAKAAAATAQATADTKAPAYTYGTTDMTAGSSALETGKLYFVYE